MRRILRHLPGAILVVLLCPGCHAFHAMRDALAAPEPAGALADAPPQGPLGEVAPRAGSRALTADAGDADIARLVAGRSPRAESDAAGEVRGVAAGTGGRPPRRARAD